MHRYTAIVTDSINAWLKAFACMRMQSVHHQAQMDALKLSKTKHQLAGDR